MRWMVKSIAPKEGENIADILLDTLMALFAAAVATEVIHIIFSTS